MDVTTPAPAPGARTGSAPRSVRILGPVTVDLPEPRIGVIGANGSGKSTLIRLFNALVSPTEGTVQVLGTDVLQEADQVRSQTGFVFTDPLVQLVMPTAGEDVELSLRRRHRDRAARRRAVESVLERYGLAGLAERSVYELSGGQRQRLALASVLATDPSLLVADEPTTLLDLHWTWEIQDLLLAAPGSGACRQLVVATHDLDFAARMDRCLVLEDGLVVQDGPAQDCVQWYRERVRERRG